MEPLPDGVTPMSARWVAILRGESALALTHRTGRRIFGLMPSAARCKFCNAPFKGRYAGAVKTIGYTPSRKNPSICARCIEHAPEGGAVVPVAVLFADEDSNPDIEHRQRYPDIARQPVVGLSKNVAAADV